MFLSLWTFHSTSCFRWRVVAEDHDDENDDSNDAKKHWEIIVQQL